MLRLNIHEAKTHLSRHLKRLAEGEVILLCKRNVPIAEIRGIRSQGTAPRPIGLDKDRFTVPESFFEALPDEVLDGFEGGR
ncbi:MAG: type II toxin-antitoxin system Phd/YefM family antitoxin [Deltaproteobacteria bacterium]|nr:type II toxin-antitoxin system Phd/YefM family antitoxin [Deltaproteobacteria bacterium]